MNAMPKTTDPGRTATNSRCVRCGNRTGLRGLLSLVGFERDDAGDNYTGDCGRHPVRGKLVVVA